MATTYIYGLVDPRDGHVKYVGKTISPRARLKEHLNLTCGTEEKNAWLKNLMDEGNRPAMKILAIVYGKEWLEQEAYWIKAMSSVYPLYNKVNVPDDDETEETPIDFVIPQDGLEVVAEEESRYKGRRVFIKLDAEQLQKLAKIEAWLRDNISTQSATRSAALRYIVDRFDTGALQR